MLCAVFTMILVLGAVAKSNAAAVPEVIETGDLRFAGADFDYTKISDIKLKWDVMLLSEPRADSSLVEIVPAGQNIIITDAKAYIYPTMGKTKLTADIPNSAIKSPKKGDTVYLIYAEYPKSVFEGTSNTARRPAVIYYKDRFITVPAEGIKIPYINDEPKYVYAQYKGYANTLDYNASIRYNVDSNEGNVIYGRTYRRNADIWIKVNTADKKQGWIQLEDARLGAGQNLTQLLNGLNMQLPMDSSFDEEIVK